MIHSFNFNCKESESQDLYTNTAFIVFNDLSTAGSMLNCTFA